MPTPPPARLEGLPDAVRRRLEAMRAERDTLAASLTDPAVMADHRRVRDVSVRKAALDRVVDQYSALEQAAAEREELERVAAGADADLAALAEDELPALRGRIEGMARGLLGSLVTGEDDAVASVIVEFRAGQGGDEASIWAGDLAEMVRKRAERRGWRFELLDASPGEAGGFKHALASVSGAGVYTEMAHEAGVHCVKRVPATETQGRVHTSTATIAVLPEPEEVQVHIDPEDVDEHITTAQGPGGQNVNKVATAVHLLHRPTGVEVRMQESKSQRQNRDKAWRLLRARVYEIEQRKAAAERDAARRTQIGAADRSERIRTYRWKENVAVDHRLEQSFNLVETLAGRCEEMVEGLKRMEIERRLEAL